MRNPAKFRVWYDQPNSEDTIDPRQSCFRVIGPTTGNVIAEQQELAQQIEILLNAAYAAFGPKRAETINTDKFCPHGLTPRSCSDCSY
jgi:hypothetical protein